MKSELLNIGIDIGGTNIKLGIVDSTGHILFHRKTPTDPQRGSEAIIAAIVDEVAALLASAALRRDDLTSIGVGVPGTADIATGTVVFAPNIFWKDVPIAPVLQSALALPVFVTQDTRAAAWAEVRVGSARGLHSIAAVTLGTGIGCGMIIDGRIFHGALNTAGEFGHQIVELDGEPCNCGRHGCLEAHAGGLAIVREARRRIPELAQLPTLAVDDVYRLAQQGNAEARRLADSVVRTIGVGLVNLINLNSLEMICLSGGISNAPRQLLLDPLIDFVRTRAYSGASAKVQICRSILGEDAALIGASLLYCGVAQAAGHTAPLVSA